MDRRRVGENFSTLPRFLVFPPMPSLSFTVALLGAAVGSVVGPAAAGIVSDAVRAEAMFLGTAALPVLMVLLLRDRHVWECPPRTEPSEPT